MQDDPYAHLAEIGAETFARLLPGAQSDPVSVNALGHRILFGDLWNRPGLSVRDRRLITLTILGIIGDERVTTLHTRAALDTGDLTPDELEAFLIHFALYAGFPRGSMFNRIARPEIERTRERLAGESAS
jgi:4-carboxymuconolactone decarboxylase